MLNKMENIQLRVATCQLVKLLRSGKIQQILLKDRTRCNNKFTWTCVHHCRSCMNSIKLCRSKSPYALVSLIYWKHWCRAVIWHYVLYGWTCSDWFEVVTGVRQECILSPLLFAIVIDWVMKKSLTNFQGGLEWVDGNKLCDLTTQMTLKRHRWACSWWPKKLRRFQEGLG